jgi:hypothetical protein
MLRQTSLQAYEEIERSGTLGRLQGITYRLLYKDGPLTAQELCQAGGHAGLWKRLSELKEMGVAIEVGEKVCRVTGHMAILWDVTADLPRRMEIKTQESSRHRIARLEQEVAHLKKVNERLREMIESSR